MTRTKNDVVVITGASAGVGRAAAKAFAKRGAKIGLLARGKQGLDGAKKDVENNGGKALPIQTDVCDYAQIENAATQIEEEFGPIDIWVNNAMATVFSEFIEINPEDFKRVTEVTYLGFVYGTLIALKRMIPRNRGVIVQVGSALAYRGIPLQSAYCGAKHAIQGFNESIRSELIHNKRNIHLTMVQMPALNTPQFNWGKNNFEKMAQPVPPIYQPEVAAKAIVWAAYNRRREIYVGFRNAVIIIGNKFFPGFGDRYLAKNGYSSQLTNKPKPKDYKNNLYTPVEGDFGAHGNFDKIARDSSWQLDISTSPVLYATVVLSFIVVVALFFVWIF